MKRLAVLLIIILALSACATAQLPKDAPFAQKAEAICSDLTASVLMAQIGLSYAQQSNYAYNYAPAQIVLVRADALIKAACAAAKTDADLVALRNSILAYLADASRQAANPAPWK